MKNVQITKILIAVCLLASAQNVDAQYWKSMGGVQGSTTKNWIGTTNGALDVRTNSVNRMYITTGGTVGIGTTLPLQTLDVNGRIHVSNGVIQCGGGNAITSTSDMGLYSLNPGFHMRFVTNIAPIRFYTDLGSNSTGGIERFTIAADGKIGIGTAYPTERLEITHDDLAGGIVLNQTAPSNAKSEIKFSKNGVEKWAIGSDIDNNNGQTFFIWDQPGSASRMIINGFGKVGIGTNPPNNNTTIYKLYVEGGIVTRDLKVTTNAFADYVFSKDYKLLSLSDLEKYLQENKHLPGIPSETEVIKNEGFEIGKLQVQMLEKLEEQALYIIDLQKQIIDLQKQFNELKSQIEKSKNP